MSLRKQALETIHQQIQKKNVLPLSVGRAMSARRKLENARLSYESARKNVMVGDLARYYRIAIFGSARVPQDSEIFNFIRNLTKELVKVRDIDIVTGGGPSIMEAANEGVIDALEEATKMGKKLHSKSIGLGISGLPLEQGLNQYVHIETIHPEFSTRLQEFLDRTHGAYYAPGGVGTLLEMVLVAQTKQVGHLENEYLLMAHSFWAPIVDAWNNQMYTKRVAKNQIPLISEIDTKMIYFSDNIPSIVEKVSKSYDTWNDNIRSKVKVVK